MTQDKIPIEVEVTPMFLMYYERFHIEDETLPEFIDRIITEHNRELSRSKADAKITSAIGVLLLISWSTAYIFEFFKFDDLWVSFIIGAVGAILYYYKNSKS